MVIPLSDSASAENGVLREDVLGDWLGTGELWGHDVLKGIRGQLPVKQRLHLPHFV